MSIDRRQFATLLGALLAGCAAAPSPTRERAREALAPTGPLRVACLAGALYATRNPRTGELEGVAVDLGRALADRVGATLLPRPYPNPGALVAGAKAGEWDVAMLGISADRAQVLAFTAPYMEVEQGYLVAPGVLAASASDIDRPGFRLAVVERTGADIHHSGTLEHATLVRTKALDELVAALESGRADGIAATKTFLAGTAARHPGARLLEGSFLVEPIGMALPKGRAPLAITTLGAFVEDAKATGRVASAIDRAGLIGVRVAAAR